MPPICWNPAGFRCHKRHIFRQKMLELGEIVPRKRKHLSIITPTQNVYFLTKLLSQLTQPNRSTSPSPWKAIQGKSPPLFYNQATNEPLTDHASTDRPADLHQKSQTVVEETSYGTTNSNFAVTRKTRPRLLTPIVSTLQRNRPCSVPQLVSSTTFLGIGHKEERQERARGTASRDVSLAHPQQGVR